MMTADVILTDHPLSVGESGPEHHVQGCRRQRPTSTDLAQKSVGYPGRRRGVVERAAGSRGSIDPVGEQHRVPAGRWDAATVDAFINKMNATATRLGSHLDSLHRSEWSRRRHGEYSRRT